MYHKPNWLVFDVQRDPATGEWTKTPKRAVGRGLAKANDPKTWGSYEKAFQRVKDSESGHILGFALPQDRSMTVIDLDHCVRPLSVGEHTNYAIADWALEIVAPFWGKTYIEFSPSWTGLHIWLFGTKPGDKCKHARSKGGAIEIYDHDRMMTITGRPYGALDWRHIAHGLQDELDALYAEIFPSKASKATPRPSQRATATLSMDDTELVARARNNPDQAKAQRFIALFDRGDISGYDNDDSRADAALCSDLAYMCGPGAEADVDRLFRRSALMRDKWERADYRDSTIAKAYEGRTAFFKMKNRSEIQDEKTAPTAPAMSDELAAALAEVAQLKAENEALRGNVVSMNEKQAQLRDIVRAPGEQVAPAEKLVAIELLFTSVWGAAPERDDEGYAPICLKTTAAQIGLSSSTVSKAFTALEKMGAFPVKRFPVMTEMGPQERIAIAPPVALRPKEWERPEGPRTHGGARKGAGRKPKCPTCGSEDVIETVMVQVVKRKIVQTRCRNCSEIHTAPIGPMIAIETRLENQDEKDGTTDAELEQDAERENVEASLEQHLENTPPSRPCIRCNVYDWRTDDAGQHWHCGSCLPVEMEAS